MFKDYISLQRISDIPALEDRYAIAGEKSMPVVDLDSRRVMNLGEYTLVMMLDEKMLEYIEENTEASKAVMYRMLMGSNPSSFVEKMFGESFDEVMSEIKSMSPEEIIAEFNVIEEVTVQPSEEFNEVPTEEEVVETVDPEEEEEKTEEVVEPVKEEETPVEVVEPVKEEVKPVEEPKVVYPGGGQEIDYAKIQEIIALEIAKSSSSLIGDIKLSNNTVESNIDTLLTSKMAGIDSVVQTINKMIEEMNVIGRTFELKENKYLSTTENSNASSKKILEKIDVLDALRDDLNTTLITLNSSIDIQDKIVDRYAKAGTFSDDEKFKLAIDKIRNVKGSSRVLDAFITTLETFWYSGDREVVDKMLVEFLNNF